MQSARFAALIAGILVGLASAWAEPSKRVTREQALEAVINQVEPSYPAIAQQFKIAGAVELEAVISENGTVDTVSIVSGNPILTKPAVEALKKWKFRPFTEGGKAVPVVAPVRFTFKKPS